MCYCYVDGWGVAAEVMDLPTLCFTYFFNRSRLAMSRVFMDYGTLWEIVFCRKSFIDDKHDHLGMFSRLITQVPDSDGIRAYRT